LENQLTPKAWKQKIIDYEEMKYQSLSGIYIKVTNVKIRKYKVIADVKITDDDVETMYRSCVYEKEAL